MFENLLGHPRVTGQIADELNRQVLPRSLLFYGDQYTGKLTAALELARALQCEKGTAEWNCQCRSCSLHRPLGHHASVIAGPADFIPEIQACGDVLVRYDQPAARYLFVRSLRKLVRRFDAGIWEAGESRQKKSFSAVSRIEDIIGQVLPGEELPPHKEVEKLAADALKAAETLASIYPADNIPIDTIRNIVSWAHTSQAAERKVVILENADRMVEGSRNSLLKILEEPPKDTYFILITVRKGAVIQTILSRLRHYYFPPRTAETERAVLEKIFRETTGTFQSLEEYFLGWKNISKSEMLKHARTFVEALDGQGNEYLDEVEQYVLTLQTKEQTRAFFRSLYEVFRDRLVNAQNGPERRTEVMRQENWNRLIREALLNIEQFNLRPGKTISALFTQMRAGL